MVELGWLFGRDLLTHRSPVLGAKQCSSFDQSYHEGRKVPAVDNASPVPCTHTQQHSRELWKRMKSNWLWRHLNWQRFECLFKRSSQSQDSKLSPAYKQCLLISSRSLARGRGPTLEGRKERSASQLLLAKKDDETLPWRWIGPFDANCGGPKQQKSQSGVSPTLTQDLR